jgi:hypothetical protein
MARSASKAFNNGNHRQIRITSRPFAAPAVPRQLHCGTEGFGQPTSPSRPAANRTIGRLALNSCVRQWTVCRTRSGGLQLVRDGSIACWLAALHGLTALRTTGTEFETAVFADRFTGYHRDYYMKLEHFSHSSNFLLQAKSTLDCQKPSATKGWHIQPCSFLLGLD